MSTSGMGSAGPVAFEQLIALNDEMAALVRAGIPLERGLAEMGRDLPGRAGRLAEMLAGRMSAGESLQQILASQPQAFPPVWRAVVEAGLRSGRLSVALESLSATARRVSELRKMVGAALLYPLVVLALAYAMFVFAATHFAPVTLGAYEDLTGGSDWFLAGLVWLGQTAQWWAVWLPLVMAILLGVWWHRSRRAAWSPPPGKARGPSRWLSPASAIGTVLRDERMAAFAELLSLLLEQRVPLQQALVLAADASGDAAIRQAARKMADRLQQGDVLARREDLPPGFPPLLGWLLASGAQQPELSRMLSRTAATYRERAARAAVWTSVYLPIALTVLVGGTATLVQGLVTFVPVWKLLYDLTRQVY